MSERYELWKLVDETKPGSAYPWMVWGVETADTYWFEDEDDARAFFRAGVVLKPDSEKDSTE